MHLWLLRPFGHFTHVPPAVLLAASGEASIYFCLFRDSSLEALATSEIERLFSGNEKKKILNNDFDLIQ